MRRVASHYTFCHQLYRMHYVELDDAGAFTGVYPLDAEIAGTEFYDGLIVPVLPDTEFFPDNIFTIPLQWDLDLTAMDIVAHKLVTEQVSKGIYPGVPVRLLLLSGITLTATELGTNYRCCNGYVKRL